MSLSLSLELLKTVCNVSLIVVAVVVLLTGGVGGAAVV